MYKTYILKEVVRLSFKKKLLLTLILTLITFQFFSFSCKQILLVIVVVVFLKDSYLSSQFYPRTTLPRKPEMIVSLCFSDFA